MAQRHGYLSLSQWQLDVNNDGGDRHGIMVAPGSGSFWETWQMKLTQSGWQASNGAKFNLNSNSLRPAGCDFGRCRRVADVSSRAAFRRMRAGDG